MLAGLLALAVAGTCVGLGFWQLDRLEQRRALNQAIHTATSLPALDLDSGTVAAIARRPGAFVHRRVRARGVYARSGEIVLRGRAQAGRPGVYLVTPLKLAGTGATALVERGWAPSPDALSVDTRGFAEPGMRTVEGLLRAIPATGEPGALVRGTVVRLDLASVRSRTEGPLLPLSIHLLAPPSPVAGLQRIPPPALGEGPHLSYAIQWFSFAAITLVGFAVVVRKRGG